MCQIRKRRNRLNSECFVFLLFCDISIFFLNRLYKKARQEPKKETTYVVTKKYMAAKKMKRPAGVKGRYKVVDARMKKDLKAQKAKLKTQGRGKKKAKSK